MKTIMILLLILVFISIIISITIFIRNIMVYKFRKYIINICYTHTMEYLNDRLNNFIDYEISTNIYHKAVNMRNNIIDKYKYEEMIFSIKPLKLDKWFTEEEVNFIEFGTLK